MKLPLPALLTVACAWLASAALAAPPRTAPTPEPAAVAEAARLEQRAHDLDNGGHPADARPLAEDALRRRERLLGRDHPDTLTSLNTLGEICEDLGDYPRAEEIFRRALAARERTLGERHADTALSVSNLGDLLFKRGDYARAEPSWRRALALRETIFGPDHRETAKSLNNLGVLLLQTGDLAAAETLLGRTRDIWEREFGPDHPRLASVGINLALVRERLGDLDAARAGLVRCVAIQEKHSGADHPTTLQTLNNLAVLDLLRRDFDAAAAGFTRVADARTRVLGADHPETLKARYNLAALRHERGDNAGAIAEHREILARRERTLGPAHPETALSLSALAGCLRDAGQPEESRELALRALAAQEKILDPAHADLAVTLHALGGAELDLGHPAEAVRLAARLARNREKALANVLSFTSEAQRLGFQSHASESFSLLATLGAAAPLAETVLRTKGAVLDSLLEDALLARVSADPARRAQLDEGRALRRQLTDEQMASPAADAPEAERKKHVAAVAGLTNKLEKLEGAMARQVAGLGRARRALGVTLETLRPAIPGDGVLVEFLRYQHELGAGKTEARYGALVLRPGGRGEDFTGESVRWVPLGPAEDLEKDLRAAAGAVRGKGDALALEEALTAVYQKVWAPVAAVLPPKTARVFLSPDGELHSLSFAALPAPGETFLAAQHRFTYLGSGRDLLPGDGGTRSKTAPDAAPRRLLVFANPQLALAPPPVAAHPESAATVLVGQPSRLPGVATGDGRPTNERRTQTGTPAVAMRAVEVLVGQPSRLPGVATGDGRPTNQRRTQTGTPAVAMRAVESETFRSLRLGPLPGAEAEGAALVANAKTWPGVRWETEMLTAGAATERRLFNAGNGGKPPRILHLATHGFFLPAPTDGHGNAAALANPMRRSGLALAGAADTLAAWTRGEPGPRPAEDDGIVSAEEVAGLDLRGCDLVTVSACDSGGGEARAGEGVLGLRRGFALAGARNLLLTLWPVEDRETAALMADFYAAVGKTDDPARALAEVQRDHLARLRRENGFAAAVRGAGAFILSAQR